MTLDVSKLSGWLNAYASCRVERRACDAGKAVRPAGKREGGGGSGVHGEGPTQGWGARKVRAERTWNIMYMFVTLEVSQLETSALKFCKPLSVMKE